MKQLSVMVKKVSGIMDRMAGFCIFAVMILIVTNIILRTAFSRPILGTYELVGFFTAMAVTFALANCALQNGHIAVGFVMERLPHKIQSFVGIFVHGASLVFWGAAAWFLIQFAQAMKLKGLVSPSAEIPVYPFIYLVALGLLGLCLVLLWKFLVASRDFFTIRSITKISWSLNTSQTAKKGAR